MNYAYLKGREGYSNRTVFPTACSVSPCTTRTYQGSKPCHYFGYIQTSEETEALWCLPFPGSTHWVPTSVDLDLTQGSLVCVLWGPLTLCVPLSLVHSQRRQPWANLIAELIRSESSKYWPNTPKNTAGQNWDLMFGVNSSMSSLDEWSIPKYQEKLPKTEWPRKHVTLQISRLYCPRFCISMFDRQPSLLGLETPVLHSGQSPVLIWYSLLASELGCCLIFKDKN